MSSATLWELAADVSESDAAYGAKYLNHYGRFDDPAQTVEGALRGYQEDFGLEVDGIFGPKTLSAMFVPRCGVTDAPMARGGEVFWGLPLLKYCWLGPKLHPDHDAILAKSFANWAAVCPLRFEPTSDPALAQIVIQGSNSKRDGLGTVGNVLGYMYFPGSANFRGQVKGYIDFAETWIAFGFPSAGTELENVLTHEIGHALGLVHSRGLMAAFYRRGLNLPQDDDDKPRIIKLYPRGADSPPPPPPPPPGDGADEVTIWLNKQAKLVTVAPADGAMEKLTVIVTPRKKIGVQGRRLGAA